MKRSSESGEGKYVMPAEWERHDATWLAWPKDPLTFPPDILGTVEDTYAKMVRALARGEKVNVLVDDEKAKRRVSDIVGGSTNVLYHQVKTADVWMRDYGPVFVRSDEGLTATKWRFNKYEELKADDGAGLKVAEIAGYPIVTPGIVLEGGSIDTNGRGTCLTTEQCLLNKNRNPRLSRGEIESHLRRFLGFSNFVWLSEGIVGDDTDGHVDDVARFVGPDTVVCMVENDPRDANHAPLKKNLELLESARDERGRRLKVVTVEMPKKKVGGEERLPASYANFYIGNAVVLVPVFDDVNDKAALAKLKAAFPEREVMGLNCESLVYGFGGIHCVTQQQPSIA